MVYFVYLLLFFIVFFFRYLVKKASAASIKKTYREQSVCFVKYDGYTVATGTGYYDCMVFM